MSWLIKFRASVAVIVGLFATLASMAGPALALDKPIGKPILTISGNIAVANQNGAAVFDRQMLESMGMVGFTTATPWYNEPVKFEGVLIRDLLAAVGAQSGSEVTAIALNDYKSTIPIEDFRDFNVMLALKRNGEYMPIRDKGPLFIVYPYDTAAELATQKYYSRSVWQVSQLVVR